MWYLLLLLLFLFSAPPLLGCTGTSWGSSNTINIWVSEDRAPCTSGCGLWDTKVIYTQCSPAFLGCIPWGLSVWYWLYSHIQEDLGGNSFFFILCSQLYFFPGRDMSPQGAEQGTKPSGNTTPRLEAAFPSDAWLSTSREDKFSSNCSCVPHSSWWAWLPRFSRHV